MNKRAALLFALALSSLFSARSAFAGGRLWRSLPVQHQGRIKPLDTFAREALRKIAGRETYKKRSAADVILSWLLVPDHWNETAFILAESRELKEGLGLPLNKRRFAPKDFFSNKKFIEELSELHILRGRGRELDSFYKALEKLEQRLILYESVQTGRILKFQPPPAAATPVESGANEGAGESSAKKRQNAKAANKLNGKETSHDIAGKEEAFAQGQAAENSDKKQRGGSSSAPFIIKTVAGGKEAAGKAAQWIALRDMKGPQAAAFQKALSAYVRLISWKISSLPVSSKHAAGAIEPEEAQAKTGAKERTEAEQGGLETNKGKTEERQVADSRGEPEAAQAGGAGLLKRERDLTTALREFKQEIFKGKGALYFSERKIQAEILYNSLKPFFWGWILYLLFLCLWAVLHWTGGAGKGLPYLFPLAAAAFGLHTLGMALRAFIMSRPPVSNMYETVLWVPWVAVIAGSVFYLKKGRARRKAIAAGEGGAQQDAALRAAAQRAAAPFAAAIGTAALCLFTASVAGAALGESLQPLQAVLRSNFWLSTHVLIVTMSYSFFFIAFVLGDAALILYLFQGKRAENFIHTVSLPLYRLTQWGVAALTLGTVLGAVWADYSWGRFWGWDPKESWALITLLGYVALLHRKAGGKLSAFGMAAASVGLFFLVVMAWYGVNFILGAGLHSYGFGSGGGEYAAGLFILHLILLSAAWILKKKRERSPAIS